MAKRLGWYFPEQLILRIFLAGSEPEIWRQVEVHSGLTLHELHWVIQCVFDWENSHLYQFLVPPGGKLTDKALSEAVRYQLHPADPLDDPDGNRERPADEAMIGRVFQPEIMQIVYEYDFGDSWYHIVKLEKRTPGGEQDHMPECLAGENASPHDDMGGIDGHYHYLNALKDPDDDMHEEAVESLGKHFDPTRFDLRKANRRLAATFKPVPKKPRKSRKKLK